MPFIPSNKDMAPDNVLELCRQCLRESLLPYFKGKNANDKLEAAVGVATNSIGHLLTQRPVRKDPLGATVMTEGASAIKKRGSIPRNM